MGNGFWEHGPTRRHRKTNPPAAVPLGFRLWNANSITFLQVNDARTNCSDMAHALVAWYQWEDWLHRPVTVNDVKIGMTHACSPYFD
jgi:hypothetical protein